MIIMCLFGVTVVLLLERFLLHLEFIKLFPHLENMDNSVYLIWHS